MNFRDKMNATQLAIMEAEEKREILAIRVNELHEEIEQKSDDFTTAQHNEKRRELYDLMLELSVISQRLTSLKKLLENMGEKCPKNYDD